jgi:predicted nucleotidyltransferase
MSTVNNNFENYKNTLIEIINKRLPNCKVYLFGSRARGTNRTGADIDLALDSKSVIDMSIFYKIQDDIEETTIPLTIDLVDLFSASETLKNEVKKDGVLWKN